TGARPAKEKDPDRILYDAVVTPDSIMLKGVELARFVKPRPAGASYGIEMKRFGRFPDGKPVEAASLIALTNTVTEVHLPAALFRDRDFVVEGKLDSPPGERVVQFQVLATPPGPYIRWDGTSPVVASPTGTAYKQLLQGYEDFRRCFPWFIC